MEQVSLPIVGHCLDFDLHLWLFTKKKSNVFLVQLILGRGIHTFEKSMRTGLTIHRFPHKFKYDLDRTVLVCLFESTNDWQESPDSPYALWCMCMHSLFLQTVQNIGTKVAPKKMTSADFPRNPQGFGIYCRLRSLYGRGDLANLANGKKLFTMFKSCWGSSPYVDV